MATAAGITSYHSMVTVGGLKKGMRVGVIGPGGLGYIGARVAVLKGAEVYAADISPSSRELAAEIGLAGVAESITEFADKDLPLIVDYAGFGTTTAQAVETLGKSGTLVQVGLGRLQATVNTQALIFKQLRIFGSLSGTQQDLAELYELKRSGAAQPADQPNRTARNPGRPGPPPQGRSRRPHRCCLRSLRLRPPEEAAGGRASGHTNGHTVTASVRNSWRCTEQPP